MEQKKPPVGIEKGKTPVQPFTHEERTSPVINGYFGFNLEDRKSVREALSSAAISLTNATKRSKTEREEELKEQYQKLADDFAKKIDPNFSPTKVDNNSDTLEKREKFYKMVSSSTVEQIEIGVKRIIEVEENDPWGSIGIHGISSE